MVCDGLAIADTFRSRRETTNVKYVVYVICKWKQAQTHKKENDQL